MSRYARENCDFEPSDFIDCDYYPEDCYEQEDSPSYDFHTKVVGVTYEGRQRYIRNMQVGEIITLEREPDNAYDKNAIKVINEGGFQIGFLSKELSATLAPKMDNGIQLFATCSAITGNNPGDALGVNIKVQQYEAPYPPENEEWNESENNMYQNEQDNNGNHISDCIKNFFDKNDLVYEYSAENDVFSIDVDLKGTLKSTTHIINIIQNRCVCRSYIKFNADENVRMAVAEYITRINYDILDGKFQLDFNDGEIHFSHCMNFEDYNISDASMNYLILYPMNILDTYGKELLSVILGLQSPEEAYNK